MTPVEFASNLTGVLQVWVEYPIKHIYIQVMLVHEYSHSGKDHDDKKYTQCLYTTHNYMPFV